MNLDHRFAITAAVAAGTEFSTTALARGIGGVTLYIAIATEIASKPPLPARTRNAMGADEFEHDVTKIDGTRSLGWIFGVARASRHSSSNTNIRRFASFNGET